MVSQSEKFEFGSLRCTPSSSRLRHLRPLPYTVMGFADIVSVCGSMLSIALFISPASAIQKARSHWEFVSRTLINTLFVQTIHCTIWLIYSIITMTVPLLVTSVVGLACAVLYLQQTRNLIEDLDGEKVAHAFTIRLSLAIGTVLAIVAILFRWFNAEAVHTLGIMGSVTTLVLLGVPLGDSSDIIAMKDSSHMPVAQVMAGFFSGICWTLYGVLILDVFVWAPSALGLLLSTIQVGLLAKYSSFFTAWFPQWFQGCDESAGQVSGAGRYQSV